MKGKRIVSSLTACLTLAGATIYGEVYAFKNWGTMSIYLRKDATTIEKRIVRTTEGRQLKEALNLANEALAKEKVKSHLLLLRVQLHEALLDEDKAGSDLKALQPQELDQDELLRAVDLCDRLEECEVGVKLGEYSIKKYKNTFASISNFTGRMYAKMGKLTEAERILTPVADDPIFKLFTGPELVRVYLREKKYDRLIERVTIMVNASAGFTPNTIFRMRSMRAEAYQALGKHKEALPDFDFCISSAPTTTNLYAARAKSLDALGKNKLADADRRKAKQMNTEMGNY